MIDRVDQARVELDLPAADHPHRARLADARLVVAVDVSAHGELGLVLGRVEQLRDLGGVAEGVVAARDGAGDRAGLDPPALDPHVHLGRGGDQELAGAQVHQRAVRRRIEGAQPVEYRGRRVGAGLAELLTQHHLEEIAPAEGILGAVDRRRVLPWLMVVGRRFAAGARGRVGVLLRVARHVARVPGGRDEVVAMPHRPVRHVVDHQDFVGHEEHQVALVRRALELELHRLELVGEVVAEGAVEAEVLVLVVVEELDHRAQQAEDRGLPAALLLGHDLHRRVDLPAHAIAVRFQRGDGGERLDGGTDRLQQDTASGLQRLDLERAPAAGDGERRGGEAQVPARVAAGELEAGGHEDAGIAVQTLDQGRGRRADRRLAVAAVDGDAAPGAIAAVAGGGFAHGALMPLAATPLSSDAGIQSRRSSTTDS